MRSFVTITSHFTAMQMINSYISPLKDLNTTRLPHYKMWQNILQLNSDKTKMLIIWPEHGCNQVQSCLVPLSQILALLRTWVLSSTVNFQQNTDKHRKRYNPVSTNSGTFPRSDQRYLLAIQRTLFILYLHTWTIVMSFLPASGPNMLLNYRLCSTLQPTFSWRPNTLLTS